MCFCIEGMLCEDDSHSRQLDIQDLQLVLCDIGNISHENYDIGNLCIF